jgi:hypothetical protein
MCSFHCLWIEKHAVIPDMAAVVILTCSLEQAWLHIILDSKTQCSKLAVSHIFREVVLLLVLVVYIDACISCSLSIVGWFSLVQMLQKGRALEQEAWCCGLWNHLQVPSQVVPQVQATRLPILATSVPAVNPQLQNAAVQLFKIAALVFSRCCFDHSSSLCTVS